MQTVIAIMPQQNGVLMPSFDVLQKLAEHFLKEGKDVAPIKDGIRVTNTNKSNEVIEFRKVTIL